MLVKEYLELLNLDMSDILEEYRKEKLKEELDKGLYTSNRMLNHD